MSIDNPIPVRLKEVRKKAKISQKELGMRIGIDESSASARMNQYEKGKHTPDISTLKKMADELGVPLNYFFCEDDDLAELAVLIYKLPAQDKKALLESLKMKIKEN
ncbi:MULTISPECIES: helix-turn-helix transcriptional regulator [Vibrio]|uniref:helix-turn-helix domain-containing protein n=1 Tax=Vibrio TaxID=662 RepID=UPI00188AAC3A|nr:MULTISPECIES: helix-turn-helix transcriptional regulator [Vibrio]MBF4249527.1 XRE family transcriptional regulator [Vibrio anguillarum]MDF9400673.1 XRE family transcriptional regulator [Vibrio sp. 1180_3]